MEASLFSDQIFAVDGTMVGGVGGFHSICERIPFTGSPCSACADWVDFLRDTGCATLYGAANTVGIPHARIDKWHRRNSARCGGEPRVDGWRPAWNACDLALPGLLCGTVDER